MRGGHRERFFFFIKAKEYVQAHNESLPEANPTPEELEAGLGDLSKDFAGSGTLYRVSREMGINPKEFWHNWTVQDYYHLSRFLTWEAKCTKDYQELIAAKNKPK